MAEVAGVAIRRVCVFSGSSVGVRAAYGESAARLGRLLAERGLGVVYGGSSVGLMGMVADAAMRQGGEVIGVIPEALVNREVAHPKITELHVVGSMHERKALMAELSDAFVALPGGFGTLEELFEIVTWAQLGIHAKPIWALNVAGYYDPLLALVQQATTEGFVTPHYAGLLRVQREPERLVEELLSARSRPRTTRWMTKAET